MIWLEIDIPEKQLTREPVDHWFPSIIWTMRSDTRASICELIVRGAVQRAHPGLTLAFGEGIKYYLVFESKMNDENS